MIGLLLNWLAFAGESQGGADVPVEENIGGGTTDFYFISREGVKRHTFYAGVDPPPPPYSQLFVNFFGV